MILIQVIPRAPDIRTRQRTKQGVGQVSAFSASTYLPIIGNGYRLWLSYD